MTRAELEQLADLKRDAQGRLTILASAKRGTGIEFDIAYRIALKKSVAADEAYLHGIDEYVKENPVEDQLGKQK